MGDGIDPLYYWWDREDGVHLLRCQDRQRGALGHVQIRLARQEDIPRILEIRYQTFSHCAPSAYSQAEVQLLLDDVDPSEFERMVEQASLFVAEDGAVVLGCGGWLLDALRHMYVSPESTRAGIGSAPLRVVEPDFLARSGHDVIRAGVILYARPFYEKNGYQFVSLETDSRDGSQFYMMRKKLP
jgi:GNAT superfamily N-acetyltransferase